MNNFRLKGQLLDGFVDNINECLVVYIDVDGQKIKFETDLINILHHAARSGDVFDFNPVNAFVTGEIENRNNDIVLIATDITIM